MKPPVSIVIDLPKSLKHIRSYLHKVDSNTADINLKEIIMQLTECINTDFSEYARELLTLPDYTRLAYSTSFINYDGVNGLADAIKDAGVDLWLSLNEMGVFNYDFTYIPLSVGKESLTLTLYEE